MHARSSSCQNMRISRNFFSGNFSPCVAENWDADSFINTFFDHAATNIMDLLTFLGEGMVQVFKQKKLNGFNKFFLLKYVHF